ncbi:DgyrCDS13245 [Dimorphilus gyrociliatus]|uniref:DgyrCDS13245 n=1 Tax=Dimorphilus gyrociliatus TaxID=2664684 RepID=A0A7I8WA38_9ANNE|nr:DgyrCDS13245 [Dimorphilus gyrociliatus]
MLTSIVTMLIAGFSFANSVEIIKGHRNLTEYYIGDTNLIISVPHNGLSSPDDIPDRKNGCKDNTGKCIWKHNCTTPSTSCKPTTVTDSHTRKLAMLLYESYKNETKRSPHMIISNLRRAKMDPNRNRQEGAYDNTEALRVYDDYHGFINQAKNSINSFGLLLDIHGQSHAELWIELGYLFSREMLNTNDTNPETSSIFSLSKRFKNVTFENLLRGSESYGKLLDDLSYKTVPSPSYWSPGNGRYFRGGYITQTYGSRNEGEIDAIQIESPRNLRFTPALRNKYGKDLGTITAQFMDKYYKRQDSTDPTSGMNGLNNARNTISLYLCLLISVCLANF